MPTFRNNSARTITKTVTISRNGQTENVVVQFKPKEERELTFWIPYDGVEIECTNLTEPPVPDSVFISDTFDLAAGESGSWPVGECDQYTFEVLLRSGVLKIYFGEGTKGVELDAKVGTFQYKTVQNRTNAPYIKFVALEDCQAVIHIESLNDRRVAGDNAWGDKELGGAGSGGQFVYDQYRKILDVIENPQDWVNRNSPKELLYIVRLSDEDIQNKYITLPEDCDKSQAITVVLAGVHQTQSEDWVLIEHESPEPDWLSWDGLAMDSMVREKDTVSVTYYKRG